MSTRKEWTLWFIAWAFIFCVVAGVVLTVMAFWHPTGPYAAACFMMATILMLGSVGLTPPESAAERDDRLFRTRSDRPTGPGTWDDREWRKAEQKRAIADRDRFKKESD